MKATIALPTATQRLPSFLTLVGLLLFAPLCGPMASAAEVYAYLGADYTFAADIYSTSDYISGVFTTSTPLVPDLSDSSVTPLSYSFSDGVFDWTNHNTTIMEFEVTTDQFGTVTSASIELDGGSYFPCSGASTTCSGGFDNVLTINTGAQPGDSVVVGQAAGLTGEGISSASGKWGPDFDPPSAPEPASVALTSAALLAFVFRARKRTAIRNPW